MRANMTRNQHQQSIRTRGTVKLAFLAVSLVLGILLVVFLLLDPNSSSGTSLSPAPPASPAAQAPEVLLGGIDRDVPTLSQGLIRIVDELSGEDLTIPVELEVSSAATIVLRSGETSLIPPLGPESTLSYRLLDNAKQVIPADGRIVFSNDTWTIRIPYFCRVVVTTAPTSLQFVDSDSEIGVFVPPEIEMRDESLDPTSLAVLFQQQLNDTTFHGAMNRIARKKSSLLMKSPCGDQAIPSLMVPAQGTYVIGLLLAEGTAAYTPVSLIPGAEVEVFVDLRLRPLLTGILLDWLGEPVPNEEIIFSTSLDMLDYDFTPKDAAGIAAIRVNGILYQTTKNSVWTDASGRFSVRVPRGLDYCIESNARGSRAFWNTRDAGIVLTDTAEIELRLENPESNSVLHFKVLRSSGMPFGGAEAQVSVADDIPFVRQWLKKPTDDEGRVRFLGLKPGDVFSFLLFHPNLQRTMYAPELIIVPSDLLVTIVVPDSAFVQ